MPVITLPDNSQRNFDAPVTIGEVAKSIGEGLARVAIAGKINGDVYDLSHTLDKDVSLQIITEKEEEGLDVIRHSAAHLMAQAVKQLYPEAQVTIGPVIDDGFYYDFAYPQGFTPDDMAKIEAKMKELAKQNLTVHREELSRDEAIEYFKSIGENYKAEIIADIPADETLSLYSQGEFKDLCRGPHVPHTGRIKAFKLMKLAGAYWRGNSDNEMLQRVYGTAWADKKDLKGYLHRLEEAEKRDHRKLSKAMDLFHTQEDAPGMVFWHQRGWVLYHVVENYIRNVYKQSGYEEVRTPLILDRSLWEKSGHWDKFGDDMFTTGSENREYAIKPMNCPCHVQLFNQGLRSYRDLPLRFAEFGLVHRNEASGTLHGLMRVRSFTQDDGHIFCAEDQLQDEVSDFISQLFQTYKDFGFEDVIIKLSTRPEKRVGTDAEWDKAEKALALALDNKQLEWEECPGEGAFYGPKIEFSLRDCLGRVWQCGTIQVDFSMPRRLEAQFVAEDGSKQTPVMLHRAILGSLERFIGILIEHYAGKLPTWLAPVQVVAASITDKHRDYANQVVDKLQQMGIRAEADLRNEKIGFKIREHTLQRIPFMLILGDREAEQGVIAVRSQAGEDLGSMNLESFADLIAQR